MYSVAIRAKKLLKLPPVQTDVTAALVEAEVEVVEACGTLHLGGELTEAVDAASVLDGQHTHDGTVLTVEAERNGGSALGGCSHGIRLGTLGAKVDTTDADVLAVIDIGDTGITHAHDVQSVAPRHGLCLHTTVGVERLQLLQRLLVEPIGHFLNGAVGIIGDFCGRHRAALMVHEGLEGCQGGCHGHGW